MSHCRAKTGHLFSHTRTHKCVKQKITQNIARIANVVCHSEGRATVNVETVFLIGQDFSLIVFSQCLCLFSGPVGEAKKMEDTV